MIKHINYIFLKKKKSAKCLELAWIVQKKPQYLQKTQQLYSRPRQNSEYTNAFKKIPNP